MNLITTPNNHRLFSGLINNITKDFSNPQILWQIFVLGVVLVLSFLIAYFLSYLLKKWLKRAPSRLSSISTIRSRRFLFPLISWVLIEVAQWCLDDVIHTSLLDIAQVPLLGIVTIYLVLYVARRAFSRSSHARGLLTVLERVFIMTTWLVMLLYVLGLQNNLLLWFKHIYIVIGKNQVSLLTIGNGLLWIGGLLVVALWLGAVLEDRLMRARSLDSNLRIALSRTAKALLMLTALLSALSAVGIDITILSVFGGALGVGLGFGLQKIASNYVSGFIILLDRSLRIGDMVTIGPYEGMVSKIKTRYTVVRSLNGIETLIPNEKLMTDIVQNFSACDSRVHAKISLSVAYSTDIDLAIRLMKEAALKTDRVLKDPEPGVTLTEFGSDGIGLELGVWIFDPTQGTGAVSSTIRQTIWKSFKEHKIEIPFPQREVRMIQPS